MIATTGSSDARPDLGARGREPVRPDHLVAWLSGELESVDGQPLDATTDIDEHFSLAAWVDGIRAGHPESVLAAAFPAQRSDRLRPERRRDATRRADGEWLDLIRAAAGAVPGSGGERSFIGDTTPTSLRALRTWAHERLDRRDVRAQDIVLAVSELATNVEQHGGPWLIVDLVDCGHTTVLAVTDPAPHHLPELRLTDPHEPAGRGLLVVASLATRWGVVARPATKTVWAAFARP